MDEIVHHFMSGAGLVIVDAPTGVGKTIIGEAVRQQLELRGVYLCSSLTLQDQFSTDFPYAKVLKGRTNYIPLSASGRWKNVTCGDCDKMHNNRSGEMECSYCDPVWACPYERAKDDALASQLVCTNTRYFLTEANFVGRFSNFPLAILDECDVMEGELMSFVEARVTNAMRKLLKLPMPKKKTVASSWTDWFNTVIPRIAEHLEDIRPTPDDSLMEKRRYLAVARLLSTLRRVAPKVAQGGWVYSDYQYGDVAFKPVTVKDLGKEYVWRHAERWLCMSATVVSPEEFVSSLGYEGRWECVKMSSPFDKSRRSIHYVPVANMTNSEKEAEWPKMGDALERVINTHSEERILVHTNSYALAACLHERVRGNRVRAYLDRNDRASAIQWFETTENAVLLASSLDRGYDGVDDLVRVVVICKLPFPYLGDKQISARLHSPGGATWYAVQTARSLVQMTGRGMRHVDDFCKVVILDRQFERFWKEWRRGVGRHTLLPDWWSEALVWGSSYRMELVRG